MPVAAVSRADEIRIGKLCTDSYSNGFFAGIEMHEAADLAGRHEILEVLLEAADRPHLPIDLDQHLPR
jgi:hypothetical protein